MKNCMQLANFTDYSRRRDICRHCWQTGLCYCDPAECSDWMPQEFINGRVLWDGTRWKGEYEK